MKVKVKKYTIKTVERDLYEWAEKKRRAWKKRNR